MGFSRQEHWSGLPFSSPGGFSNPGIEPRSPALQADSLPSEAPGNGRGKSRCQDTAVFNTGLFEFLSSLLLKFMYVFLAALGLCCCTWAFSSCYEWGLLASYRARVSVVGVWASVVAHGPSCSEACGIFLGSILCPLHGRGIPNHWITTEVQSFSFIWLLKPHLT